MSGRFRRSRTSANVRAERPAAPAGRLTRTLAPTRLAELVVDPAVLALGYGRLAAMALPVIASCRNLVCGTIAQLDVQRSRAGERLDPGTLLTRPDPDRTWASQIEWTVDDLAFYGRAYWLVLAFDGQATDRNPRGMPVRARWVPATQVEPVLNPDLAAYTRIDGYRVGGTIVEPGGVIAFDAGHDGILSYGARTLAAATELEDAARRFSGVELPAGTLTNTGHELSPTEAAELVAGFETARRSRTVAFLQGIEYQREALNPADLQLVEARAQAATDLARLWNMPVALVSASPTGGASALLYANLTQQQALLLNLAVAPYLRSIEGTLAGEDVTPRGQRVDFQTGQWLRTDPQAAADYATALEGAGIISTDEARSFLGLPPAQAATTPNLAPGKV